MSSSSFFDSLDLFKQPLCLRISRKEKASTKFGILISIIIYIFLAYSFSQNDFFKRLNPLIIIQTTTIPHPPNIKYQGNPFAFSVKDNYGKIYQDQRYFTIIAQEFQTITLDDGELQSYATNRTFHLCKENEVKNPEDWAHFNNSYCLDNNSFELEGAVGETLVKNFQIHLFICQNSTESNITCKSPEEISAFFRLKHLSLTFFDQYFDPKNYENPISTKSRIKMYKIDSILSTLVTINMQQAQIITDESSLHLNPIYEVKETSLFEKEKLEYGMLSSNSSPIASILFYSSDQVFLMNRSYQKLSDALAVLGGLLSCLMVLGKIISQIDKTLYITIVLMNYLYSFQQPNNPYSDKSPPKKQVVSSFFQKTGKEKDNEIKLKLNKEDVNTPENQNTNDNEKNGSGKGLINKLTPKNDNIISLKGFNEADINQKITSQINLLTPKNDHSSNKIVEMEKIQEKILCDDSFMSQRYSKENSPKKRNSDPLANRNVAISTPTSYESRTRKIFKKSLQIINNFGKKSIFGVFATTAANVLKEKSTLEQFIKFRDQKNQIVFTIFDYAKFCLKKICRISNNLKEKLFIRAQEIYEKEIDIIQILQRIKDIEKLKYLLLNENQMALFNILEKPMIYVDENRNPNRTSLSLIFGQKKIKTQIQMQKAFEYYQELEKGREMDEIDKKLFLLVEKRFKTFQKYFQTA